MFNIFKRKDNKDVKIDIGKDGCFTSQTFLFDNIKQLNINIKLLLNLENEKPMLEKKITTLIDWFSENDVILDKDKEYNLLKKNYKLLKNKLKELDKEKDLPNNIITLRNLEMELDRLMDRLSYFEI